MSNELTAGEAAIIKKATTSALKMIFEKHDGRDRRSITEIENENCQPLRSDGGKMIAKMHSTGDGREIRKAAAPGTNASAAIAAMHSDRALAGRTVPGNQRLVAKLAGAIASAVERDFASAREAKAEIRKILSDDAPRPRNYSVLKMAKAKSGIATLTHRKGSNFLYLIEVDSMYLPSGAKSVPTSSACSVPNGGITPCAQ